jgi:hypothetical protein
MNPLSSADQHCWMVAHKWINVQKKCVYDWMFGLEKLCLIFLGVQIEYCFCKELQVWEKVSIY